MRGGGSGSTFLSKKKNLPLLLRQLAQSMNATVVLFSFQDGQAPRLRFVYNSFRTTKDAWVLCVYFIFYILCVFFCFVLFLSCKWKIFFFFQKKVEFYPPRLPFKYIRLQKAEFTTVWHLPRVSFSFFPSSSQRSKHFCVLCTLLSRSLVIVFVSPPSILMVSCVVMSEGLHHHHDNTVHHVSGPQLPTTVSVIYTDRTKRSNSPEHPEKVKLFYGQCHTMQRGRLRLKIGMSAKSIRGVAEAYS